MKAFGRFQSYDLFQPKKNSFQPSAGAQQWHVCFSEGMHLQPYNEVVLHSLHLLSYPMILVG